MKSKIMRFVIGILLITLAGGCTFTPIGGSGSKSPTTRKLQLSGSSTLGPLASEIAKRFESQNPGVRIEVQTGGSSRGISDAGSGIVNIGMSSRELKPSEENGKQAWPVAMDGVCFIVHANNPITELTPDQIRGIFQGAIRNWNQVGGNDGAIHVINRTAGRSEVDLVSDYLNVPTQEFQADLFAGENQQGIKMVASDEHAITYMSVGASEYEAQHGTAIRLLPLEGVEANSKNVASGKFPLGRPLLFITSETPSTLTQEFIAYARSSEVHDLVQGLSYVPLAE